MTRRIRWGILSTAKIGLEKVIPAMQRAANCEIVAIASRDADRARIAAEKLGIPRTHGSYEALLADPQVEAVYNPLPNHLHVPLSIAALEAGKHVLCEKPIALTVAEAQTLVAAANRFPKLKIMEAFMYRFHPQWQTAKRLAYDGSLGVLQTIQTFFSYYNDDLQNIRNQAEIGGGGLMDIGCYAISLSRFIFGCEPEEVCGHVEFDPRSDCDRLASAVLNFRDGRTSSFTCATQTAPFQRVQILGTVGRVEIEIPFNAPHNRPCRLWHQHNGEVKEILLPVCDQYTLQGEAFARAILDDMPVPTPLNDAVQNMRVIEAILASHRSRRWESVGG